MGCVNADGSLTPVALQVLRALSTLGAGATADAVARATGLPPYRARASLRELQAAGFVTGEPGSPRVSGTGVERLRDDHVLSLPAAPR